MILTTRIKVFLKQHTPEWFFIIIRPFASSTINLVQKVLFSIHTVGFRKRMTREISWGRSTFELVIDPQNGYLDAFIYAYGLYEPSIVSVFEQCITQHATCIDVGANIGHHTIIMSQLAGEDGSVFSYEPIPSIQDQLKDSLSLNQIKNVTVVPCALSDTEGSLSFRINKTNVAGSSFVNTNEGKDITVQVRTLDSFEYPTVDFIKIDVEGFEYHVLLGATETIERCKPKILIEYSPEYYQKAEPSHSEKILDFFVEKNYRLFDLEDNSNQITDIKWFLSQFGDGLRSQTNILALPKKHGS